MAHVPYPAGHYQRVEITTADPFELVLILYKGAIHQLNRARIHFCSDEIEQRVICINKAISMIAELHAALDYRKGGEIAANLGRLYAFMLRRLTEANLEKDRNAIDEVLKLLQILKSTWEEARQKHLMEGAKQTAPRAVAV